MTRTLVTPVPVSVFHSPVFDDRDAEIIQGCLVARAAYQTGPLVGDWIRLDDDTMAPIAEISRGHWARFGDPEGYYYLEPAGTLSYRGKSYRGVPVDVLHQAGDRRQLCANIFHHNQLRPDNEVSFFVDMPVWQCPWLRNQPTVPE